MRLGPDAWKLAETFYSRLTLITDGVSLEQEFAARDSLTQQLPHLEIFWKRHVCPATQRPLHKTFRPHISPTIEKIARISYSIADRLLDADDLLTKVLAGDLGPRNRNWRYAIEAAGNSLQLTTELEAAVSGIRDRKKKNRTPERGSLANVLDLTLDPFPDWETHWAARRTSANAYRNYLIHKGLLFTVTNTVTNEVLVLGRAAFGRGVNWLDAASSYASTPTEWQPLPKVAQDIIRDTVAFVDATYARLLAVMDPLLVRPAYQMLWGWRKDTPIPVVIRSNASVDTSQPIVSMHACSASATVDGPPPPKPGFSDGGCTE